jgi:sterol O-acyltransferase
MAEKSVKNANLKSRSDKNANTLSDILEDVRKLSLKCNDFEKMFNNKGESGKREQKSMKSTQVHLPDRHFQARNSLLTDLFEIKHISTIYHIFIVIFTLLLLNVFVSDFAAEGRINVGLHTIIKGKINGWREVLPAIAS